MIERTLQKHLAELFTRYPIITVTGPRQAGKTTLCRLAFPDLDYVNLEAPDTREFATEDPRGFLRRHPGPAILDEVQRTPSLLSYLQEQADERRQNGLYVLTGSQNLGMSQSISQSLAGRTALLCLLPFSIPELMTMRPELDVETMLYTGFYPRIHDQGLAPTQSLGDYFETYVERDVRQISEIRNLGLFQKFVRLCAGRVGQVLNFQALGNDAGVSHTTARQWLSVLEASFVVFLLPPYHANVSKRLVKSPKLYFYDVGLASYLLGIEVARQVFTHPLKGSLFENLVIAEVMKYRYHRGRRVQLHFYRDSGGLEVDLIYPLADRVAAVEIKSAESAGRHFFSGLEKLRELLPDAIAAEVLVYGGNSARTQSGVRITPAPGLAALLEDLEAGAPGRPERLPDRS